MCAHKGNNGSVIPDSLTRRMFSGSSWLLVQFGGQRLFDYARILVVARLIGPTQFGIWAIAFICLEFFEALTFLGVRSSVINRADPPGHFLQTAWTLDLIRGVAQAVLLLVTARWLAGFLDAPDSLWCIVGLAPAAAIRKAQHIGMRIMTRAMQYRELAMINLWGSFAGLVVAVAVAAVRNDAWAMIIGYTAIELTVCLLSHLRCRPTPRFELHGKDVRALLSFGKWMHINSLIRFGQTSGVLSLISMMLGTVAVGGYRLTSRIVGTSTLLSGPLLQQMVYPAYAQSNSSPEVAAALYRSSLYYMVLLLSPVAALLHWLAPWLIPLVFGPDWGEIIPLVQVMAWLCMLIPAYLNGSQLFIAMGNPRTVALLNSFRLFLTVLILYPLCRSMGLVGVAWAVLGSALFIKPVQDLLVGRELSFNARSLVPIYCKAIAPTVLAALPALAWNAYFPATGPGLLIPAGIGLACYLALLVLMEPGLPGTLRTLFSRRS